MGTCFFSLAAAGEPVAGEAAAAADMMMGWLLSCVCVLEGGKKRNGKVGVRSRARELGNKRGR